MLDKNTILMRMKTAYVRSLDAKDLENMVFYTV